MITTPNEAIKKIEKWFANDMNQPIAFWCNDVNDLFSQMFNTDRTFSNIYKTPKEIPAELVATCFEGVLMDDRVQDAIIESYKWDIDKYIEKQLNETDETELWN